MYAPESSMHFRSCGLESSSCSPKPSTTMNPAPYPSPIIPLVSSNSVLHSMHPTSAMALFTARFRLGWSDAAADAAGYRLISDEALQYLTILLEKHMLPNLLHINIRFGSPFNLDSLASMVHGRVRMHQKVSTS
ncbi:short-chain dehydrogenase reductase sdr [Moniliophthora roreri]|nr:short-chain dehydrogenase reductase sdr [Moniliophthora roreri]